MKSFLIDNFTAVHLKKLVEKAREAYANERAVERQIAKLRDQIQLFADTSMPHPANLYSKSRLPSLPVRFGS